MSNVYIDEEQSNKCSSFADKLPNTIMINVNFSQTLNITKKEIKFAGKIKIKLYPSTLTQEDLCSSLLLLLHPPSYGCLHRIPTGDNGRVMTSSSVSNIIYLLKGMKTHVLLF